MILLIDNYDSFTYNLYQYLRELGVEVMVERNDKIEVSDVKGIDPGAIVISPGPCTPQEAGISVELVHEFKFSKPILGVCLGHQTIAFAQGGQVVKSDEPVHGKVVSIRHNGRGLFKGLKNPLEVTRYHSLVVERKSLPGGFEITAETARGEIMGISRTGEGYNLHGVQFHPEALLTECGHEILANFLCLAGEKNDKGN